MALSRSIRNLLELAEETSAGDDNALDALGRQVLEAIVADRDAPEHIREQAARLLRKAESLPSSDASRSDDALD